MNNAMQIVAVLLLLGAPISALTYKRWYSKTSGKFIKTVFCFGHTAVLAALFIASLVLILNWPFFGFLGCFILGGAIAANCDESKNYLWRNMGGAVAAAAIVSLWGFLIVFAWPLLILLLVWYCLYAPSYVF